MQKSMVMLTFGQVWSQNQNRQYKLKFSANTQNWMGGGLCDNWKPSFLNRFIFNWSTFLKQVTALW